MQRRLPDHEDMILRFVSDLAVPFTNSRTERDIRRSRLQQCASGGCWRNLTGLADFAVVTSHLSTAASGGLDSFHVFTQLLVHQGPGYRLLRTAEPC